MSIIKKSLGAIILVLLLASCVTMPEQLIKQESRTTTLPQIPAPLPSTATLSQPAQNDAKATKKKVKVAVLVPLSGKNKDLGTAIVNSIILSLFENDRNNNVELVIFDNKGTPEDSSRAIKEIAAQNIKTVIGPIFSTSVQAVARTAKDNNITILSFSNNQDLMGKSSIFLMGFLPEQQVERMVSYAISQGKNSFAIIAPSNQYGIKFSEIIKEMVKRKDGNFITSGLYLNNANLDKTVKKTVDSYIISARALEIDSRGKPSKPVKEDGKIYANTILVPESGAILSKTVSLIKKYNTSERDIQIIGSSAWDDISTLNDPNLIGGWFVAPSPEKYRDFEKRYYQIYNKFPPRISSIGYDAMIAIIQTINQSKKTELKTTDFINYSSPKNAFEGIDGLFRFLPNGIVQRNFAILQVGNGKFEAIDSPSNMFFKY